MSAQDAKAVRLGGEEIALLQRLAARKKESDPFRQLVLSKMGSPQRSDNRSQDFMVLREESELIIDRLGDEFCAKGLGPDDEPTAYGLLLEDLIDRFSPGMWSE